MINRVRRKFSAQGRLVWRERSKDYTGYDKPIREFACRSWIGHISADYTIDARTDNVVRIGSKKYDKRYTSTGSNGTLNLYAKGLIDLNVEE